MHELLIETIMFAIIESSRFIFVFHNSFLKNMYVDVRPLILVSLEVRCQFYKTFFLHR